MPTIELSESTYRRLQLAQTRMQEVKGGLVTEQDTIEQSLSLIESRLNEINGGQQI